MTELLNEQIDNGTDLAPEDAEEISPAPARPQPRAQTGETPLGDMPLSDAQDRVMGIMRQRRDGRMGFSVSVE